MEGLLQNCKFSPRELIGRRQKNATSKKDHLTPSPPKKGLGGGGVLYHINLYLVYGNSMKYGRYGVVLWYFYVFT